MKIRCCAFNIYLLAALFLVGCKSPQEKLDAAEARRQKKEFTAIRFHLEAGGGGDASRAELVSILRSSPTLVKVESSSILDERDVVAATVSDFAGGFVIQIRFDQHGVLVLDGISSANRGKRLAILADFGEKRWLAAPVLSRRITDGTLTFTPDATHEEAVRIVRGLNNTIEQIRKDKRFLPSW